MLTMTGTLRACTVLPASVNRKTGEAIPARHVVQIEITNNRGLIELQNLSVPSFEAFAGQEGQPVTLPVRAYIAQAGGGVAFAYNP